MNKTNDKLYKIRHSLAHLLAKAALEYDPNAKIAIGPPVDNGFYYDFEFEKEVNDKTLKELEKKMRSYLNKGFTVERYTLSPSEAKEKLKEQPYKLELLQDIEKEGEEISFYKIADFEDLCEGPHVSDSSEINSKALKLDKVAGAYWRGDEKNKMLTRIYGLAFETEKELQDYLQMREEAKKRDHRKLGKELGLFTFSELVGAGMPLYTPKGAIVLNEIINLSREFNKSLGFQEVITPNVNKAELFKVSGHYEQYKEDMLSVRSQYVSDEMFLKPMNCPQHTQIYASQPRSYKDLPVRFSDFANLYRDERPGELSGLTRLRAFRQDDGHSFCREDQIESEISNILSAIQEVLKIYNVDYKMRLSLRDPNNKEKYIGGDEIWNNAESVLRNLLKEKNISFTEEEGEAAFYGPKIDIVAIDALGREWQISTVQVDFNMPKRFALEYTDKDGSKKTPVMIHRALVGSPDRFLGLLIEHYAGKFPLWLAPTQIYILPIADAHTKYAQELLQILQEQGFRADIKEPSDSLGKRIREFKKDKVPYALVLGDKEANERKVTAERRDGKKLELPLDEFMQLIKDEVANRTLW